MRPDLDLTDQQVFDKIVAHLRTQGVQATDTQVDDDTFDSCYYRLETDGETLKCAVGGLIPDDCYLSSMEGRRVGSFIFDEAIDADLRFFLRQHMAVIFDMQQVHDHHFTEREQYFRYVAAKHHLLLDGKAVNIPTQENPMEPDFKKRQAQLEAGRTPRYPDANDGEL